MQVCPVECYRLQDQHIGIGYITYTVYCIHHHYYYTYALFLKCPSKLFFLMLLYVDVFKDIDEFCATLPTNNKRRLREDFFLIKMHRSCTLASYAAYCIMKTLYFFSTKKCEHGSGIFIFIILIH